MLHIVIVYMMFKHPLPEIQAIKYSMEMIVAKITEFQAPFAFVHKQK